VFVAPERPIISDDLPPDLTQRTWAPISATLISGEQDAVLVDATLTSDQALALGSWIAARNRTLTTIYITHGHGDHFFGLGLLLDRFPRAQALATPAVIAHMRQQMASNLVDTYWNVLFPGQLPQHLVVAFDDHHVITAGGDDLLTQCALAVCFRTSCCSSSPRRRRRPSVC
jgi:glyoxylase-like metal-dependent hydrolase (beta-lactamase superfamily II)